MVLTNVTKFHKILIKVFDLLTFQNLQEINQIFEMATSKIGLLEVRNFIAITILFYIRF